ncbi:helix-turn-helix domain-containing protein [Thalassomonas viridans]|uniref:helix-turn-helix domain-containing protein n=1 Tax=Thalassomonas viridans TaxID=137584 RepID=UPI0022A9ADE4|nr:helix-turn-helix domain-containing protein [Thalassomonas viridans]
MSILTPFPRAERRRIEKAIHKSTCKHHVRRLTAILILVTDHNLTTVSTLLAAGRSSVKRWLNWYKEAGLEGLKSLTPSRKATLPKSEILGMLRMLIELNPQELGYQRARWSTELLTIEINRLFSCDIHSSTIRRWLPEAGLVWRRAAPTLHIKDPHKEDKLHKIQEVLANAMRTIPFFMKMKWIFISILK